MPIKAIRAAVRNLGRIKIWYLVLIVFFVLGFGVIPANHGEAANKNNSGEWCNQFVERNLYESDPLLKGPDVMEVQKQLKALGYPLKNANGVYDSATVKVVREFQKDCGLRSDGVTGPQTLAEMGKNAEIWVINPTPPPPGKVSIVVDVVYKTLTVYSDGEVYKVYPVAVGKSKTPTPIGDFQVRNKRKNWGSGFGSRWLGLSVGWGIYGIHGTNKPWSIGYKTSHGCIRMHNRHVEELYPWVQVGTPVTIKGNLLDPFYENRPTLRKGARGSTVLAVQKRLQEMGYYQGSLDGIFGQGLQQAIKKFQEARGFPADGVVSTDLWPAMEL